MDLNFVDKVLLLLKQCGSSFLMIELFILFLLLLIYFFYNEKRQNKFVKVASCGLLLFLFCQFVFFYQEDVLFSLMEIGKLLLNTLYFPNIVFYIFTVFCSILFLIHTLYNTHMKKWEKRVSYLLLLFHFYLFLMFISTALTNGIRVTSKAAIYQHDILYVLVETSQRLFLFYLLFRLVLFVLHKKIEKKEKICYNDLETR